MEPYSSSLFNQNLLDRLIRGPLGNCHARCRRSLLSYKKKEPIHCAACSETIYYYYREKSDIDNGVVGFELYFRFNITRTLLRGPD